MQTPRRTQLPKTSSILPGGRPRRALIVTRPGIGGAAYHVELLCRSYDPALVSLTVLASPLEDAGYLDTLRRTGVRVKSLPMARGLSPVRDLLGLFTILLELVRGSYDVVHAHTSKPGLLARLAGLLAGTPRVLYTPHGYYFTYHQAGWRRHLYSGIERVLARVGTLTLTLSAGERNHAERMAPGRVMLLPNAVPEMTPAAPLDRARVRQEHGFAPDSFLAVMVGRLEDPKQPEVAIDAVELLSRRGTAPCLLIVGDGSQRAALAERAARLARPGHIVFAGARPDAALLQAAADVAVLSSRAEGLPYVLLEAAAAGVPAIASDLPGCREVIEPEETGLVFPAGDSGALAAGLSRLSGSPALRATLGSNARQRVRARNSLTTWADRMMAAYIGPLADRP